jgi:hypothetical protein
MEIKMKRSDGLEFVKRYEDWKHLTFVLFPFNNYQLIDPAEHNNYIGCGVEISKELNIDWLSLIENSLFRHAVKF